MTIDQLGTAVPRGPVSPTAGALGAVAPLGHGAVTLDRDGWLGRWRERTLAVTLPHVLTRVEDGEAGSNLARLAGRSDAPRRGMVFTDSDVYKTLEAVAWASSGLDPAGDELGRAERLVALLAAVQEPDGYLNSCVQGTPGIGRWSDPRFGHELYCAGHLFQAAVAAEVAGVLPQLRDVAARFADLLVDRFGDPASGYIDGHPEVETALVELYRLTGRGDYLRLAAQQVERRGHGWLRDGDGAGPASAHGASGQGVSGQDASARGAYYQDAVPVREAAAAVGHAVRQLYLLAGVVDVAVETGDRELLAAAVRIWDDLDRGKTYVTGAHGSRHRDEAIGDAFELPADRAYAETCAAIGAFQLAWRLLLATGEARYADAMDTLLHNAIAGAVSADGDRYFYSNPLQLRTGHDDGDEDAPTQRLPWYSCACCPPNIARLLASVHDYLLTRTDDGIQIQHPTSARADVRLDGGTSVRLDVRTRYPYDGTIDVVVETASRAAWELAIRVPGWCRQAVVRVDGRYLDVDAGDGYARVRRVWQGRHDVRVILDLPVRVLAAHPRADAVRGCVALARGPLVYALEQADLPPGVVLEDVRLVGVTGVSPRDGDGSGPVRVTVSVRVDSADQALYTPVSLTDRQADRQADLPSHRPAELPSNRPAELLEVSLLPYHLWANRTPGAMRVWIPVAAPSLVRRFREETP